MLQLLSINHLIQRLNRKSKPKLLKYLSLKPNPQKSTQFNSTYTKTKLLILKNQKYSIITRNRKMEK
jgi:hypothetical protein